MEMMVGLNVPVYKTVWSSLYPMYWYIHHSQKKPRLMPVDALILYFYAILFHRK